MSATHRFTALPQQESVSIRDTAQRQRGGSVQVTPGLWSELLRCWKSSPCSAHLRLWERTKRCRQAESLCLRIKETLRRHECKLHLNMPSDCSFHFHNLSVRIRFSLWTPNGKIWFRRWTRLLKQTAATEQKTTQGCLNHCGLWSCEAVQALTVAFIHRLGDEVWCQTLSRAVKRLL